MAKERPILFNTDMVRAILDGRKTQTRRIMQPQPPEWIDSIGFSFFTPEGHISGRGYCDSEGPGEKFIKLPYLVGDILWVRETWAIHDLMLKPGALREGQEAWFYKGPFKPEFKAKVVYAADYLKGAWQGAWRPSIHMPREAARLFLKVTNVRVERLQDITEKDAEQEGCQNDVLDGWDVMTVRQSFQHLWDAIYAKQDYGWDANPWVFVIEFEVISHE